MCQHHPEIHHTRPTYAWDEAFSIGIANVDAQHQRLFLFAEKLNRLYRDGAQADEIHGLIDALQHFATDHFETEEALMAQHSVSPNHRGAHRQAHQSFIRQLRCAASLSVADPSTAAVFLLTTLTDWLLHHVAGMDRALFDEIDPPQPDTSISGLSVFPDRFRESMLEQLQNLYGDLGFRTFQIIEHNRQLQLEIEQHKETARELATSNARFKMMADHAQSWEYWVDPGGTIIYMSPACLRITGYAPEAFMADPDLLNQLVHPDDRHLVDNYYSKTTAQNRSEEEVGFRIFHCDGSVRWIVHSCQDLYSPEMVFLGHRVSNRDITDRYLKNDSMLLMANVFESINEAALVTDENNRIIVVNSAFTLITGYEPEEVIGKNPSMLIDKAVPPAQAMELLRKITARGRWQGEINYRRKNGARYTASVSITSIRDQQDLISHFFFIFSDITEKKESEQRIFYLSHHDHLTGLPNWKLFSDRAHSVLEAAIRTRRELALLYVDIDRFKHNKDILGHEISDLLIIQFAARLQSCLGKSHTPARIGSDEFLILVPDEPVNNPGLTVAEKLLDALRAPFQLENREIAVSATIGISLYPAHGSTLSQLIQHAEWAAFQAKRAGGGAVRLYDATE